MKKQLQKQEGEHEAPHKIFSKINMILRGNLAGRDCSGSRKAYENKIKFKSLKLMA
jgi:hypothetical protein